MYTDGTAATLQRVNDAEKDAEAAAAAAAAAAPAAPAQRAAAPAAAATAAMAQRAAAPTAPAQRAAAPAAAATAAMAQRAAAPTATAQGAAVAAPAAAAAPAVVAAPTPAAARRLPQLGRGKGGSSSRDRGRASGVALCSDEAISNSLGLPSAAAGSPVMSPRALPGGCHMRWEGAGGPSSSRSTPLRDREGSGASKRRRRTPGRT